MSYLNMPALMPAATILLGFGILQVEAVMICVSNIVGMGIKRNCLIQLGLSTEPVDVTYSNRNLLTAVWGIGS